MADLRAIRGRAGATAGFSPAMERDVLALKEFLLLRMYRHPRVMAPMEQAQRVIAALFGAFSADPALLPQDWGQRCGGPGDAATISVVRDYIAGMTDRYALQEHQRVLGMEIAL